MGSSGITHSKNGFNKIPCSSLDKLKQHVNYKMPIPEAKENEIEFASRCISHLISPPQIVGESDNIECVDLAAAILEYSKEITETWNYYRTRRKV